MLDYRAVLDIFVLNSHIDRVVYDLEVGDATADIWKILSDKELKSAFNEVGHTHKYEYLEILRRREKSGHPPPTYVKLWRGKAYGLTTRRGINNARGANRDAIARKS